MTGRDLIVYILENHLEDEPVYKDGKFVGFLTTTEVAVKLKVGVPTVYALMTQGDIKSVKIEEAVLIPAVHPLQLGGKNVKSNDKKV